MSNPLSIASGVPFDSDPRPLTELFDHTVARHGDRPAVDFMGRVTSFAELSSMVDRIAAGLQAIGVEPGTRVGLCLPNITFYPAFFLAVLRAGGIIVNLNPLYVERELSHLVEDSGAEVIVTVDLPEVQAKISAVAARLGVRHVIVCPIADALPAMKRIGYRLFKRRDMAALPPDGRHIGLSDLLARGRGLVEVEVAPEQVAVLQYTGGTTGVPKAAMLSHANLVANADATLEHFRPVRQDDERILGVLPLFHVFALTTVLTFSIRSGSMMVLLPRFDLKQVLDTIERTRPTYFPAVPTIYAAIAREAEQRKLDFSSVRACISGGAPLPSEVREKFVELTGTKLVEGYGLSEASPIITCNPLNGANKPGSAGIPYPGTTIEIRDPEGSHALVERGAIGEICARGPQVMTGYWNRPDATRDVFVERALRTGDLGYIDDEDYLFIVDRLKDMIIAGGYNIYPGMIEAALYEHPAVAEAVVIGVPDSYRGQAPKAFVVLADGEAATPEELREFLTDKLSKIEMPREIELRTSLPKTLIGKHSKKELIAEEEAKAAASSAPAPGA